MTVSGAVGEISLPVSPTPPASGSDGYGSPGLRMYVLVLLMLINAMSLVDRVAIGIVQEPIKHEFTLTDFQLGMLGGPAFAILYSLLGLPAAQLSERRGRISIVSISLTLWSLATAACGLASSYATLLASRLGVSFGEAGCNPPSQAVIVDYFPSSRRTTALAIYNLGVPLAAITAGFGGGWLADSVGWRWMFVIFGLPGLAFALLLKLTVPEPPRSHVVDTAEGSLAGHLRELAGNRTLWHMMLGASMSCFVGYGLSQYLVSFLMRAHGMNLVEASSFNGVMFGVFAAFGTFGCGYMCDRLAPRFPRVTNWLPAIAMLVAAPLYLVGYLARSMWVAAPFLFAGAMLNYFYMGAIFAVVYGIVRPHLRTLAAAVTILLMNLIGYGMGPPVIGLLSDNLRIKALGQAGLDNRICLAAEHGQVAALCAQASASGLRLAIVVSLFGYVWSGLHFLASVRTVRHDWVA